MNRYEIDRDNDGVPLRVREFIGGHLRQEMFRPDAYRGWTVDYPDPTGGYRSGFTTPQGSWDIPRCFWNVVGRAEDWEKEHQAQAKVLREQEIGEISVGNSLCAAVWKMQTVVMRVLGCPVDKERVT